MTIVIIAWLRECDLWHPGTMLTNLEANVDALDDDDDGNVVFGVAPKGDIHNLHHIVYTPYIYKRGC